MRTMTHRPQSLGEAGTRVWEKGLELLARVSPSSSAYLDWWEPSKHSSWGGPMNGQVGRQQLIRDLARSIDISAVIETGTYRGTTSEFLWHVTGAPVFTVEIEPRFCAFAQRRFAGISAVQVTLGESRQFLSAMAEDPAIPKRDVLFYFDAHWGGELPLEEELRLVHENWRDSVIIIDDFQVPSDSGYGFDDYGPGKALTLDYLLAANLSGLSVLYPALASCDETGARRGCCVLTTKDRAKSILDDGVALLHVGA